MAADSSSSSTGEAATTTVFEKHTQDEISENTTASTGAQMSWSARFMIFILFPSLVGGIGLYMGYLESLRKPERELSFDNDFVMPFLLALTFALVVGFQTKGYRTDKVEPLVKWPKVKRKKVIRKVKKGELEEDNDEGDNDEDDDAAPGKDQECKKDD